MNRFLILIILLFMSINYSYCNNIMQRLFKHTEYVCDSINIDSLVSAWNEDSCGCLNKRTPVLMRTILDNIGSQSEDLYSFIRIFGKANETRVDNNTYTLIYYFNSICYNGIFLKLKEGYCEIEVEFKDKILNNDIHAYCY